MISKLITTLLLAGILGETTLGGESQNTVINVPPGTRVTITITITVDNGNGPVPPTPIPPNPGPLPVPPIPPEPIPPIPTPLTGTAKVVYDSAMRVSSPNRLTEARTLAQVFRQVASRAAGLQSTTPLMMFQQTSEGCQSSLSQEALARWDNWKNDWANEMKRSAGQTRESHISAWNETAKGLEAVPN